MKTTVITGASTGIGQSVSIELAKEGYNVFLLARSLEKLEQTKKSIENAGGSAQIVAVDLSSVNSINDAIDAIKKDTPKIDLIANIAGIWHGKNDVYAEKDFETFDQQVVVDTFTVGTIAPALLVHSLLPLMGKCSKIINLSGTFENGGKGWLPYFVSKRSIEDFTVGLSHELEDKGIQVNRISPSDTATDSYARFFPQYMEEAVEPIQIARLFVQLSDPQNAIIGKVFVVKKGSEIRESFHF